MKANRSKLGLVITLAFTVLLITACGTLEVGIDETVAPAEPTPAVTIVSTQNESPTAAVTTPAETPTPTLPPASPLWTVYRDDHHGFGVALPCFWRTTSPTVASYDENFFLANSTKGQWKDGVWPPGALKFDMVVFEEIDPSLPLEQVLAPFFSTSILSVEETKLGPNPAFLVTVSQEADPNLPDQFYFFRLTQDKYLLFSLVPRHALQSEEIQAILESVALSAEEQVRLPGVPPNAPVAGRTAYLNQEAGYCLMYPAEFTLEEYQATQPNYVGKVAAFTLERPTHRITGTITARQVGPGRNLEELVENFLNQFSDADRAAITRSPVLIELGGEPVVVLDGVPGPDGSMDVFSLHGERLYQLTFTPSPGNNPQAEPDLYYLLNVLSTSLTYMP